MPQIKCNIKQFNYDGEIHIRRDLKYNNRDYIIQFDYPKYDPSMYFINNRECEKEEFYEIYNKDIFNII